LEKEFKTNYIVEFITYTRDHNDMVVDLDYIRDYIQQAKGIDKELIDSVYGNAVIKWQFEFETRTWGVKNLSVYATSIGLEVIVEHYASDDWENDDLIETEFDLSEYLEDFAIESEIDSREDNNLDCFFVKDVEIDFKVKKILVTF
jgi:hypothetical protein